MKRCIYIWKPNGVAVCDRKPVAYLNSHFMQKKSFEEIAMNYLVTVFSVKCATNTKSKLKFHCFELNDSSKKANASPHPKQLSQVSAGHKNRSKSERVSGRPEELEQTRLRPPKPARVRPTRCSTALLRHLVCRYLCAAVGTFVAL